jgi:crossover junction endodeoxyribonuclease RuvC
MPTVSLQHQRRPRPVGAPHPRHGSPYLVIGLDPGLSRTGYGAVRVSNGRPCVREAGVLLTGGRGGRADLGDRLLRLHGEVTGLLRDLRPDLIVIEDVFAHQLFPRTAILLGHARGIICLAAAAAGLPVVTLAPGAVKQAVTGSGRAGKAQVQAAVRRLLGLRRLSDSHAADALALAYTGLVRTAGARVATARARARSGQATGAVGPG